jgi:hypothetical protein
MSEHQDQIRKRRTRGSLPRRRPHYSASPCFNGGYMSSVRHIYQPGGVPITAAAELGQFYIRSTVCGNRATGRDFFTSLA